MGKPLVSDELWTLIEPLLPLERPKPKGGRPPIPHRAALTGILFVLLDAARQNGADLALIGRQDRSGGRKAVSVHS